MSPCCLAIVAAKDWRPNRSLDLVSNRIGYRVARTAGLALGGVLLLAMVEALLGVAVFVVVDEGR